MDKKVVLNYKRAVQVALGNIKVRGMFNKPFQLSEGQTDANPLPFVSEYLRAEQALLDEIDLSGIEDREAKFLLSLISDHDAKPALQDSYLSFAVNEIFSGLQQVKERITGVKPTTLNLNAQQMITLYDGIKEDIEPIEQSDFIAVLCGKTNRKIKFKNRQRKRAFSLLVNGMKLSLKDVNSLFEFHGGRPLDHNDYSKWQSGFGSLLVQIEKLRDLE